MFRNRWLVLVALLAIVRGVPAGAAETKAFFVTSDFSNGGLSVASLDDFGVTPDVATVHSDARIRWFQGLLYVINRFGQDNIQVIDPSSGYATIHQFSVGNGSNPADILVLSPTRAYVTRYGLASILIVNPVTGGTLGQISLAPFADADGIPEMDRMIRVGNRVFVSIQRLDENNGFQPTDSSLVAVIDPSTDTVLDADPVAAGTQAIKLTGTNPATRFVYDPVSGRLLLGCVGRYGQMDGGVEWIDPTKMKTLGYAATEAALGGDIGALAWNGAARSYAIVTDAAFNGSLIAWSAITGLRLNALFTTSGYLPDCDVDDRGRVWLCDADIFGPGTYVFSTTNDQQLAGPLDTGLPPNQVVFDRESNLVTAVATAEPSAAFAASWPNPARSEAFFDLTLAVPTRIRIEVFDAAGRRVRTLADGTFTPGTPRLRWDLADDADHRVEPGLYFVHAKIDGKTEKTVVRRLVVLY